jgi:3'(2'), 5'-bisphosphate nucleotidase
MPSTSQTVATLPIELASLLRLTSIAQRAGDAIMGFYRQPVEVCSKGDAGPVTAADIAAHRAITAELEAWDPRIPLVSEEGVVPPWEVRQQWPAFWLIDPLDGTKEFLAGNGEFTVNIALIVDRRPVLGVVYAPALGEMYFAGHDLGAWRQRRHGRAIRIRSREPQPGQPLRIVESRSHRSAVHEAFVATLKDVKRLALGSSLKFCRVAEGRADIYPRLGPTMEWDVAAGDCVFRCSGRHGERWSPIQYNSPELRIPSFIVGLPPESGAPPAE